MISVQLAGTNVSVSRLSFGTSRLHRVRSHRERQDILAAAIDHGFTHFDTAPLYGFGLAETELGTMFRRSTARLSVATKVGLYPPRGAQPTVASVWTRKILGRLVSRYNAPLTDWSLEIATRSLDLSLRRLGVDCVDLLLLHDPVSAAFDLETMTEWVDTERARGRVRAWGLAGDATAIGVPLMQHGLGSVLQLRDSVDCREADALLSTGRQLQLTYGYLSSSSRMAGVADVANTLKAALRRNQSGSILVSARSVAHVAQLASIAAHEPQMTASALTR
jgi:D-threo-aldose 1-dehydrogenase